MTRRAVLASAGHVDHGKSTLVRALTGIEPDRLAEERRRGRTLDLGFAWTTLPSGAQLAFVDVPGHERFIATMLAGLGPVPAVLFVVAADEGWSRQSGEHLAAVDALEVRHGLLAVTRADLADPQPVLRDAGERLGRSSLGPVAAVAVSGVTGAGLPELRTALDDLVTGLPEPDATAPVRLWLDRSFSIRGSGTVVTATLADGAVAVGDELSLDGRTVTVRGLQSAGAAHDRLTGTARVALNLRGVPTDAVARGDVLLTPGAWHRTAVVDARLTGAPARLAAELTLHAGTAAVPARVRPLGADHARITLARPLPLRAGDRAVLRDPGRHAVAAGVLVLDADPPPLERRGAGRARAVALADARVPPDPAREVARRGAVRRTHLDRLGVDSAALPDVAGWLVDPGTHAGWVAGAPRAVRAWAAAHPLDPPMPLAALAHALGTPDDAALLASVTGAAGLSVAQGRATCLDAGTGGLGPAQRGVDEVVARLRAQPFRAPEAGELAELGLGRRELAAAVRAGTLLTLDGVVLLPDAPDVAVAVLRALPAPFTLSAARQALDTTRRVAVPLLEHLDGLGRTRPVDGARREVVDGPG